MAVAVASVLVWAWEMRVIRTAKAAWPECLYAQWAYFSGLGGSQEAVLANLTARPWLFAKALVVLFGSPLAAWSIGPG